MMTMNLGEHKNARSGVIKMHLVRSLKLKIVLAILLPYAILAVSSAFIHNHNTENSHIAAALHHSGGTFDISLSSTSSIDTCDRSCPACVWTSVNVSSAEKAFTVTPTAVAFELNTLKYFIYQKLNSHLVPSRAPPFS
jgi:hypothetical protein